MEEGICTECGRYGWTTQHHVVFKQMGSGNGLDFPLNLKRLGNYLSCDCHKNNKGPHLCKEKDSEYKRELQVNLRIKLTQEYYTPEKLCEVIGTIPEQLKKAFKTLHQYEEGYLMQDVVKRLMGGKLYE